MLILTRILSPRALRSVMAFRRVQKQRQRSDELDGLTVLVALVVGLRTYLNERCGGEREGGGRETTLNAVLRGRG